MNNIFSISRFANLFKKHTTEHYKTYLMSLVVLMGILLACTAFFAYVARNIMNEEAQFGIYISFMLISGTIFTSGVFTDLSETKKAIATLTLPASHFEKFMVKWLYSYVIFVVLYTCVFYMIMIPVQSMIVSDGHKMGLLNIFRPDNFRYILISYTLAHAITMLGAIMFKKLHFIKTCFTMIGIFIVITVSNKWIVEGMIGRKVMGAFPFLNFNFIETSKLTDADTNHFYTISLPENAGVCWTYALVAVFTLLFWAAAYSRLKEKQV